MNKVLFITIIFWGFCFNSFSKETNSDSIYQNEIKEFDKIINKINEDIKKEKKDINFLKTSLINNEISASKLVVKLINKDDGFFKITKLNITMNGNKILSDKSLDKKELTLFNESSSPGLYTFNFDLYVEGAGYGIFTYMKSYKFRIKRTVKVKVHDIGKSKLNIIIYKKGEDSKHPEKMLGIKIENDRS